MDTTPLFGVKSKMQSLPVDPLPPFSDQPNGPKISKPNGVKNMSDLLDEILQSPTQPPRPLPRPSPPNVGNWGSNFGTASFARKPNMELHSLSLSERQRPPSSPPAPPSRPAEEAAGSGYQDDDKMDWSPTTSRHRAFSSFRGPGADQQGFSQAPTTEEKRGAFWYRVPPAPVAPAHRAFNPPNQPRLRSIPAAAAARPGVSFREAGGGQGRVGVGVDVEGGGEGDGPRSPVAFARPSFFSPAVENDPRNTLADDFGKSFTLATPREERGGWLGGLFGGKK